MFKSIPLSACLVCLAALLAVGTVSTQAGAPTTVLVKPLMSVTTNMADPGLAAFLLPTIESHAIKAGNDDTKGKDKDRYKGKDKDKYNGKENDDAPAPAPEPSTLLSFGVALIIGGGVFFLGRLRKERK